MKCDVSNDKKNVEGQEHCTIKSRYYSGFFVLRNQVLVPSGGQELGSFAEKDKNIVSLRIRLLSKYYHDRNYVAREKHKFTF